MVLEDMLIYRRPHISNSIASVTKHHSLVVATAEVTSSGALHYPHILGLAVLAGVWLKDE